MSKRKRKRRNRAANRNVSMPRANAAQGQKASESGPVKPVDTSTRYEWHPHCQKEIEARKANRLITSQIATAPKRSFDHRRIR